MVEDRYMVLIGSRIVGENMTIDYATMFVKAIFDTFHEDQTLAIQIIRMNDD